MHLEHSHLWRVKRHQLRPDGTLQISISFDDVLMYEVLCNTNGTLEPLRYYGRDLWPSWEPDAVMLAMFYAREKHLTPGNVGPMAGTNPQPT